MTIPTRVRKSLNTAGSVISSRKFRLVNIKDGPGVVEQKTATLLLECDEILFRFKLTFMVLSRAPDTKNGPDFAFASILAAFIMFP